MTKIRTVIMSCVLILVATFMMGTMYIFSNVSYSYTGSNTIKFKDIEIKNIQVIKDIDNNRVEGPRAKDDDIILDIDLEPYETYSFKYDVINKTGFDYVLEKSLVSCLNDEDVNKYLSVSMTYDNGTKIQKNDLLPNGTQRTIVVTVSYNKNVDSIKNFVLSYNLYYNNK